MFYHIRMRVEYPEGKWGKTQDYYKTDLSQEQLREFVARYQQGLPLIFDRQTVTLTLLQSLEIGATSQSSRVVLPPIKADFERKAAAEKARTEAENRRNRIVVYNPYDISGVFFANRTLLTLADDQTASFIQKFTSVPQTHISSGNPDPEADGLSTIELVTLQKQRRFRYLAHLYQSSAADSSRMFHWREVGAALRMSDDIAAAACSYLRHKKLANGEYMTDGISQAGIDEYEQAITKPDQPTEHFPQQVTINTGHSSNIMMSSPGAHQTVTSQTLGPDMAGVAALIRELGQVMPRLGLDPDMREDVEMLIVDLQAQVEQQNPDRRKVRAALRSVGSLFSSFSLSVAANALTQPILTHLHELLPLFTSSTS